MKIAINKYDDDIFLLNHREFYEEENKKNKENKVLRRKRLQVVDDIKVYKNMVWKGGSRK